MNKGEIMSYLKKALFGIVGLAAVFCGFLVISDSASALSMTPMKQMITLTPGDTYSGRVTIYQQGQGNEKLHYQASIVPLTVNDEGGNYSGVFDKESSYTDVVNWVTLANGVETVGYDDKIDGYAVLGEEVDLIYTINVPKDARGGGHYFAVMAKTVPSNNTNGNVVISDSISIASVVYAEVAGDINIKGTIKDNNIPGFLLNPPITASFVAKNERKYTFRGNLLYASVSVIFERRDIHNGGKSFYGVCVTGNNKVYYAEMG